MEKLSLSKILKHKKAFKNHDSEFKEQIQELQLKLLRIQQGIWHNKGRAIIVFEGFDAAGKGGAIRKITEILDPRGFKVHPIGPPETTEQNRHWLYRFWTKIPEPGTIAIFDRSWYGRILVERAEKLTPKQDWSRAFSEINQFEKMLSADGVEIIKIFLAVTKEEQIKRFEERLSDPYKQWKLGEADLRARKKWKDYVTSVDQMLEETNFKSAPWILIPADDKHFARKESLQAVSKKFSSFGKWMKTHVQQNQKQNLRSALLKLKQL